MASLAVLCDEGLDGLLELPIQDGSARCGGSRQGCHGEHEGEGSELH
jgi:hypothetical protein